jgi:NCS1 family nucleobase:cation symporter-1
MSKFTQKENGGLYELTDAARAELVDSKYYNEDLAPTSLAQRTWTTYNIASLWIGMSVCLPSYTLASSLIALGMSTWAAVINVALGNLLVLIPMQLNSHAGTKYGIPYPVFARLTFGPKGAHIPSLARALVAGGWCGIQIWFGGGATHTILVLMFPGFANVPGSLWITFFLFWALNIWIGYKGTESIKWLEFWGAPILGVLCIALVVWATMAAGAAGASVSQIINTPQNEELIAAGGGFWPLFLAGLTANISFWATLALNIPDFSRYAKSQKAQFRGQLYGLPTTMAAFAFIGAYVTTATGYIFGAPLFDPVAVIASIGSPLVSFLGAVGVIMATITTNIAANIVAPANGLSNISPKRISYKTGVLITGFFAVAMMPWKLLETAGAYIFGWLGTYGIMLGPLAGIYIADYYIVKKRNIDVLVQQWR